MIFYTIRSRSKASKADAKYERYRIKTYMSWKTLPLNTVFVLKIARKKMT